MAAAAEELNSETSFHVISLSCRKEINRKQLICWGFFLSICRRGGRTQRPTCFYIKLIIGLVNKYQLQMNSYEQLKIMVEFIHTHNFRSR